MPGSYPCAPVGALFLGLKLRKKVNNVIPEFAFGEYPESMDSRCSLTPNNRGREGQNKSIFKV